MAVVDVADVIRVDTTLRGASASATDFGVGLLATTQAELSPVGDSKFLLFPGLQDVIDELGSDSEAAKAATAWFSQNPPPEDLYVGRWIDSATGIQYIRGGQVDDPASLAAISKPRFTLGGHEVAPDFSAVNSMATLATAVQTGIQAADTTLDGVTVVIDGSRLLVTGNAPGSGAVPDLAALATNGTIASDETGVADLIGLSTAGGAVYFPAIYTETMGEFLNVARERTNNGVRYFMLGNDCPREVDGERTAVAAAAYIAASNDLIFSHGEFGEPATVTDEESTDLALIAQAASRRVLATYSRMTSYKHVSAAALLSGQDLDRAGGAITMAYKDLPGQMTDTITEDQARELVRKRANYFISLGGLRSYINGFAMDPDYYADMVVFLDWFAHTTRRDILALLAGEAKVPQTDDGISQLASTISAVCERSRDSGAIATGTVGNATRAEIQRLTGNLDFDGELLGGYLVYFEPLATQPAADRAGRMAPRCHVWLKLAGAVQELDIHVILII